MTSSYLAKNVDDSGYFQRFVEAIFTLDFKDTPNYESLSFYLEKCLNHINEVYDHHYDWNK